MLLFSTLTTSHNATPFIQRPPSECLASAAHRVMSFTCSGDLFVINKSSVRMRRQNSLCFGLSTATHRSGIIHFKILTGDKQIELWVVLGALIVPGDASSVGFGRRLLMKHHTQMKRRKVIMTRHRFFNVFYFRVGEFELNVNFVPVF